MELTGEQQRRVYEAVEYLEQVEPGAGAFLLGLLEKFVDSEGLWVVDEIIACMLKASGQSFFSEKQWKQAVRAFMFAALILRPMGLGWDKVADNQDTLTDLLQRVHKLKKVKAINAAIAKLVLPSGVTEQHVLKIDRARAHISRAAWRPSCFTKPQEHDPDNYCYLITALIPSFRLDVTGPIKESYEDLYGDCMQSLGAQSEVRIAEYYLRRPERLGSVVLSCSVISHEKHKTYKNLCFGFILRVPEGNIMDASSRDMNVAYFQTAARGTDMTGMNRIERIRKIDDFLEMLAHGYQGSISTPSAILQDTSAEGHNEILVLGSYTHSSVTPCGIFIKVIGAENRLWQEFVDQDAAFGLAKHIKDCAQALAIPIVCIRDARGKPSALTFDEWRTGQIRPPSIPRPLPAPDMALSIIPVLGSNQEVSRAAFRDNVGAARRELASILGIMANSEHQAFIRGFRRFALLNHPDRLRGGASGDAFRDASALLDIVLRGERDDEEDKRTRLLED